MFCYWCFAQLQIERVGCRPITWETGPSFCLHQNCTYVHPWLVAVRCLESANEHRAAAVSVGG